MCSMEPSNIVKVLDVYRVASSPSSPGTTTDNIAYLPLTFFDILWLRFPPTQRVFFYEIPNITISVFLDTILPKLKHSLSVTLQHYPPLAGNLTWDPKTDKPAIQYCQDDVVLLTVAESGADFHYLSGDGFKEAKEFHALLPDLEVSETQAAVIALQVTLFQNYGFSIGYSAHHAVLDGKSAAMFMKSWASICKLGDLKPELMPLFDRAVVVDPANLGTIFMNHWMENLGGPNKRTLEILEMKPPPELFRSTFRLTREEIGKIKSKINCPVSSFSATCAYIWTCLVKSEGNIMNDESVCLGISIDSRARLEPSIPSNYIGNCVSGRFTMANVASLRGHDGVVVAAAAIGEVIGSLAEGVLKGAEEWIVKGVALLSRKVYSVGGSPRFELYSADFGWGRPKKIEMVSIDKSGAFSLSDCSDGDGGIEIGIVLKKPEIEAFGLHFAKGIEAN